MSKRGIALTTDADADRLTNIRFADDLLLCVKSSDEATRMLEGLSQTQRRFGLELNLKKTNMRTRIAQLETVTAGSSHKYLGRVWSDNDNSTKWHNDFGGSVWISGFSALTGNLGFYHGGDGNRLVFSVGFNF